MASARRFTMRAVSQHRPREPRNPNALAESAPTGRPVKSCHSHGTAEPSPTASTTPLLVKLTITEVPYKACKMTCGHHPLYY